MSSQSKQNFIEDILATAPASLLNVKSELKLWVEHFVSNWLSQQNLVTKEEFDLQVRLLEATQKQNFDLEKKLNHLEKIIQEKQKPSAPCKQL